MVPDTSVPTSTRTVGLREPVAVTISRMVPFEGLSIFHSGRLLLLRSWMKTIAAEMSSSAMMTYLRYFFMV